jgi:hypothetical protein
MLGLKLSGRQHAALRLEAVFGRLTAWLRS